MAETQSEARHHDETLLTLPRSVLNIAAHQPNRSGIKDFKTAELRREDGFCMVLVGMFRGSKVAYYGFFTDYTM